MKQTSLFRFSNKGLSPGTKVVDLFCGIGGFSCGAKQAGHAVVLAVDCDPFLLGAHVRNHPGCTHMCCSLPRDDLPLPTEGQWHLHASPPCTKLSIMQPLQYEEEKHKAIDLVAWYLELVQQKRPTSWSMEQVNHEAIRTRLAALKAAHPLVIDWMVVDAVNYEVPQNRKRIIAGSPFLIASLRSFKSNKRKRCVEDVIPNPSAPFIRNNLYTRPDEKTRERYKVDLKDQMRPITKPCYTILATGAPLALLSRQHLLHQCRRASAGHKRWCDESGKTVRHVNAREGALIQSFPPEYMLPWSETVALVGVGNAIPPQLVRVLMSPTKLS